MSALGDGKCWLQRPGRARRHSEKGRFLPVRCQRAIVFADIRATARWSIWGARDRSTRRGADKIAADSVLQCRGVGERAVEVNCRRRWFAFEKEYIFLEQTMLKRKLSPAQTAWKEKINRRILAKTKVRQRTQR
jgi:hypothetical protein